MRFSILVFFSTLIFGFSFAQAHELRSPVGASLTNPSELNAIQPTSLNSKYTVNFGADFIYEFDSYGIGLRYDSVSALRTDGIKDGDMFEISAHLFSLIGRKRWELEPSRFGPQYIAAIGTAGFYAPSQVATHPANSIWTAYKTNDVRDITVGVESGWIWDPFLVGAEVGYQYIVMKGLATDQGVPLANSAGTPVTVDLSGPYFKVILGLRFF